MAVSKENTLKLKECFSKIVKEEPLNLTSTIVMEILESDLGINTSTLDESLLKILPNMIAQYIGAWAGWNRSQDFTNGKLKFAQWYSKFKAYIDLKVKRLIDSGYEQALKELIIEKAEEDKEKAKSCVDNSVQTDNITMKSFAPFCLDITCPPELLNTLAFGEINEEDIMLQQHQPSPWCKLTMKELLHWPHITIHFQSPHFSFTRKVSLKYQRHISAVNTKHTIIKNDFIESVSIIDENIQRKCYTYNIIEEFLGQYKRILERLSSMNQLEEDDYHDIILLFTAFLMDIKEINIKNSIATNTSIVFNIGKSVYTRNKKVKHSTNQKSDVTYIEMMTPYIELKLDKCDITQDETDTKISFQQLNELEKLLQKKSIIPSKHLPQITFECTFCQLEYTSKFLITTHLYENHHMEQCVLCSDCKVAYKVEQLTSVRWSHNCATRNGS